MDYQPPQPLPQHQQQQEECLLLQQQRKLKRPAVGEEEDQDNFAVSVLMSLGVFVVGTEQQKDEPLSTSKKEEAQNKLEGDVEENDEELTIDDGDESCSSSSADSRFGSPRPSLVPGGVMAQDQHVPSEVAPHVGLVLNQEHQEHQPRALPILNPLTHLPVHHYRYTQKQVCLAHRDDRPCDFIFRELGSLKKHLRRTRAHTGMTPYHCSVPSCNVSKAQADQFAPHLSRDHGMDAESIVHAIKLIRTEYNSSPRKQALEAKVNELVKEHGKRHKEAAMSGTPHPLLAQQCHQQIAMTHSERFHSHLDLMQHEEEHSHGDGSEASMTDSEEAVHQVPDLVSSSSFSDAATDEVKANILPFNTAASLLKTMRHSRPAPSPHRQPPVAGGSSKKLKGSSPDTHSLSSRAHPYLATNMSIHPQFLEYARLVRSNIAPPVPWMQGIPAPQILDAKFFPAPQSSSAFGLLGSPFHSQRQPSFPPHFQAASMMLSSPQLPVMAGELRTSYNQMNTTNS